MRAIDVLWGKAGETLFMGAWYVCPTTVDLYAAPADLASLLVRLALFVVFGRIAPILMDTH